jgi:RHS repeat-associated protein
VRRGDIRSCQPASASWLGLGWDLSLPSITKSGSRYFLNLGPGVGGEIVNDPATGWRLRGEKFVDIVHSAGCESFPTATFAQCPWTIKDQAGRTYLFGANKDDLTNDSGQYYGYGSATRYFYRWDLTKVSDLQGNVAQYNYHQIKAHPSNISGDSVISAYPSSITYPGGRVRFRLRGDADAVSSNNLVPVDPVGTVQLVTANGNPLLVRPDVVECGAVDLIAFETRALDSIVVESENNGLQRTAEFDLNIASDSQQTTSCSFTGNKLVTVASKGRDGGLLTTPAFTYTTMTAHSCFVETADRLASVTNGFGGETDFVYDPTEVTSAHCSSLVGRFNVQTRTAKAGSSWTAAAPPVVTTYSFGDGPHYVTENAGLSWLYRGYRSATETDSDGNQVVHSFITGDESSDPPPTISNSAELAGRETKVETYGPGTIAEANLWRRITNTYVVEALNSPATIFFDHLTTTVVHLKDGSNTTTTYGYDNTSGTLTSTRTDGGAQDCKVETTSYQSRHDSVYLVLPRIEQVLPCGVPSPTPAAETVYFYDGSSAYPPATQTPITGNLTAVRRLADASVLDGDGQNRRYVYTYHSYYANGMPKAASVPIYGSRIPLIAGSTLGAIPSQFGSTLIAYDAASMPTGAATGRFPSQQTVSVFTAPATPAAVPTQVTALTYDATLGVQTMSVAPNGLQSETAYDEFGRPTWSRQDPDPSTSPTTEYAYTWTGGNGTGFNDSMVKHRMTSGATTLVWEHHCFDGLGQELESTKGTGTGQAARTTRLLNGRGLLMNSHLYGAGCLANGTNDGLAPNNYNVYDPLGEVSSTTFSAPGTPAACSPSCVTVDHNGRTTTTTDQLGHRKDSIVDGLGRVTTTREYTGTGTYQLYSQNTYTYDVLGNLLTVTDLFGHQTVMTYDNLGRKQSMVDPDMSGYAVNTNTRVPWTYTYDAAGNVLKQIDARGATTTIAYDSLNRILSKTYDTTGSGSASTAGVAYQYDTYDNVTDPICTIPNPPDPAHPIASPVGKLTIMTDGSGGSTRWCYDIRGRAITERHTIVDAPCATSESLNVFRLYDSANRTQTLTYPDGEVLTYGYVDTTNGGGALTSINSMLAGTPTTLISAAAYHVSGSPASITFGNGYTTTYGHDNRYRLSSISTSNGTSTPQNLAYEYDEKGNIARINDLASSDDVIYKYDEFDRITEMRQNSTSPPTPALASYSYGLSTDSTGGAIGNLMSNGESGGTLAYANAEHIHAPSSSNGGWYSYTYDKNGNMSAYVGYANYTFDVENRLVRTYQQAYGFQNDYFYDGAGNLVRRRITSSTFPTFDQKNLYVGGIYEELSYNGCSSGFSMTKNYMAFGRIIATRGASLMYLLADHLGSTVGAVYSNGTFSTNKYFPFGTSRGNTSPPSDKAFTGQQQEAFFAFNAYYFHARFYSPDLGHFLSADIQSSDGLNRFGYVRNNPMRYNDPTGHGIPLGGGLDEGACPASDSRCAEDGAGPLGGTGAGHDNCPNTMLTCVGRDPSCDARCQGLVACALAPSLCDGSGSSPTADQTPVPGPAVASPLPAACGGPCPTAPTDTSSNGCWLCGLAHGASGHAGNVAKAACDESTAVGGYCPAIIAAVRAAPSVDNMITSSCFHGVVSAGLALGTGFLAGVALVTAASTGSLEAAAVVLFFSAGSAALSPAQPPPGVVQIREGLADLRDCM